MATHDLRRHQFEIRAGLGRNEWTLLIAYPDRAEPYACMPPARGMTSLRLHISGSIVGSSGSVVSPHRQVG